MASYPASTYQRARDRRLPVVTASCAILVQVPPPYDVHNFLNLLGIEIDDAADGPLTGYFTVTHRLIAGTGFLWAPVVVSLADALCAFLCRHDQDREGREEQLPADVDDGERRRPQPQQLVLKHEADAVEQPAL